MIPEDVKKILKKQHYEIVGKHSAVQVCRWTKKSLKDEGVCYKEQFYGIKSHLCCQMTPAVMWCPNKCIHCWRAIELTLASELGDDVESPSDIIDGCIKAQQKLLTGFNIDENSDKKQLSRANQEKLREAQEPMQFAISLAGEPTVYKHLGGIIDELRKRGKTSFLVTNGLYPEKLQELIDKNQLPTQLYISVNSPNKEMFDRFHRSTKKNGWELLMRSLELMSGLRDNRTVFRMNLVKGINLEKEGGKENYEYIKEYADLIKKAEPMFIEIKGYMSVGFARERLGYDKMPTHQEIKDFANELVKELNDGTEILDEKEVSSVLVLGKDKLKIKIPEGYL